MKIQVRYAYALTLALAPACGDDGELDSDDDTGTQTSTTEASSSSGTPTTGGPSTGDSSSSSTGPETESGTGNADESSTGEGPFAECSRDGLEEDYYVIDQVGMPGAPRWYGPGADEDGNLLDDGETEFVVSVTYLALNADADFGLLAQLNGANAMALYSNPGMVATQLGGSMACGSLRTFTVWDDNAALMAFVGSKAHLQSMGAFPAISRGGSTLSIWQDPAPASDITLDNAMARMASETPYD